MEGGALAIETSTAPDASVQSDCNIACLRRRAWAQSKDSLWQDSQQEKCGPQDPQKDQRDGEQPRPAEEPGRVPNKITSWLIECRTPIGASLDDRSASPNRGVLRNGCSFEDDLSLGAEANHLQSINKKPESCFGLVADQKRTQYKEKGRSMNSTGSGKSSTVSSVSELLDLYEEDPEEILFNLGFGREEPDPGSKVPSRFFNSTSTARGIDIKVYLGAQLQRMELENPSYALTSRFRQIEVLTTVANEFFNLYSQVSGNPIQRICSKDQGGEAVEGGGGASEPTPSPKRTGAARNMAKLLKKTITRHNLLAASGDSAEATSPGAQAQAQTQAQVNGHATPSISPSSDHTHTNGTAGPEQDGGGGADPKHGRKKDSCPLATVTEETNGDGETEDGLEQSGTAAAAAAAPAANGVHPPQSADTPLTEEGSEVAPGDKDEEKNLTSTPEKHPPALAPPKLAQLRIENADSFDMEEIQSNDDESLPNRTSRASDLLRTVSQQSDSSGFAEEPSVDSNSFLKVQESSDSCDSENTVTSHPSLDLATPLALDHPAFDLPDCREEEVAVAVGAGPGGAAEADGETSSAAQEEDDERDGGSPQILQYIAHHLPRIPSTGTQRQDETGDEEEDENVKRTDLESEPEPEPVIPPDVSAVEQEPSPGAEHTPDASQQEPQNSQTQTEPVVVTESPSEGVVGAEDEAQDEPASVDSPGSLLCPPAPSSPLLGAMHRARQNELWRTGQQVFPSPQSDGTPRPRGRGRGRGVPLQRSASLPTQLSPPSRVVSSVRIQFGRGQMSVDKPRFSFKYNQEDGQHLEEKEEEEKENKEEGQTNCVSSVFINPASKPDSNIQPQTFPAKGAIPPKSIPRYLMRSSHSLRGSSPPLEYSPDASWSTQSVPDLSPHQQQAQPVEFQQNLGANPSQPSWNQGQMMFHYTHPNPNMNPNPTAQYLNPSPIPSPGPYPYTVNPHMQYASPFNPYNSLPNLFHHHSPSSIPHSGLPNVHQPTNPMMPQHGSLPNVHQPMAPHQVNVGNMHPGSPAMNHQAYSHLYGHHSPYHQFPSPYLGYPGYHMSPQMAFPPPMAQGTPSAPEPGFHPGLASPVPTHGPGQSSIHPGHASPSPAFVPGQSIHPGLAPHDPGFLPGLASPHGPSQGLHPGLASHSPAYVQGQGLHPGLSPHDPGYFPGLASAHIPNQSHHPGLTPPTHSATEIQLRRVLNDIRGTVLSMKQADSPDVFAAERRAAPSMHQSLAEFQQKRRSLNLFRSQMMDLELSIIRQQALVYKHLSPADRLELEQLQSLRTAVREELQELEQQLEDRLIDMTQHSRRHRGLHRGSSVDSLSTASAVRAMEPMSDLLKEQLFLQSQLGFGGRTSSTNASTRSSSPVRSSAAATTTDQEPGGVSTYRASVSLTPTSRPGSPVEGEGDREPRVSTYTASINLTPTSRPGSPVEGEGAGEQGVSTYRASINITPMAPPRSGTHTEEGGSEGAGGTEGELEEDRVAAGLSVDCLQQLIREIRESVAQEVRREIYSELLATVSPRSSSPASSRRHPL